MRQINLAQIEKALHQSSLSFKIVKNVNQNFSGIGTDTRADLTGQLFIALVGDSFDAHNFIEQALAKGASGILIHKELSSDLLKKSNITIIQVEDTLKALQALGAWSRRDFTGQVIGITGSNGKTTTKEFTAALIGTVRKVHFNRGSFNNHWGVPFTLLQLPSEAEVAVVEMGMNHAGEITSLSEMVAADSVVCTTVGRAHIEHFGTVEKIAAAKEEIYYAAPTSAAFVFNLDNLHTLEMYRRWLNQGHKTYTFSATDTQADVHLQLAEMDLEHLKIVGSIQSIPGEVTVPVFGEQNLVNLMAAAALGLSVGMKPEEIWSALPSCKTAWGRNQLLDLQNGARAIFDAYNANPDSMKALLMNIRKLNIKGQKVGVFGEMLEMGDLSEALHFELGQVAAQAGFSSIYFIGKPVESFARGLKDKSFSGRVIAQTDFSEALGMDLRDNISSGDIVVFKGSRGMRLERFLKHCDPLNFSEK